MTFSIHRHRWLPTNGKQQDHAIYILHGLGEHAGRYKRIVKDLNELGFVVGAHDHPGHGKSDGRRGVIEPDHSLVDCALEEIKAFAAETKKTPIVFGHSLGGVVASTLALDNKIEIAGLILSAPGLVPILSTVNRFKVNAFSAIAPYHVQEFPYDASRLTLDTDEQEKAENDPLTHRSKSASLIMWLIDSGEAVLKRAEEFKLPTLVLVPEDDPVIDSKQTLEFTSKMPQDQLTLHTYPNSRHELLNEVPKLRNKASADIKQWLLKLT